MIVCGFLTALYVGWREANRQGELDEEVLDFAFWALVGGLVGARVVFIIVNWEDYAKDPAKIFVIWRGGLVFYGAFLGGVCAFLAFAWKNKWDLRTSLKFADYIAVGIPLGQVFGRMGCMAAGCCWGGPGFHFDDHGKVIQDLPFAARFPAAHDGQPASLAYQSLMSTYSEQARNASDAASRLEAQHIVEAMQQAQATLPLIPSQLLEAAGASLVFLLLLFIRSRKWFHGQMLMSYAILYAMMRFGLEFFRGDAERGVGLVSTSQGIALGVVAVCLVAIVWLRKQGAASLPDLSVLESERAK